MRTQPAKPLLVSLVLAARDRLVRSGTTSELAAFDAEVLAREALGWSRAEYLARCTDPAPEGFAERFEPLVRRREAREPVSQILGRREFWGRSFEVTRDVLTPRPETEFVGEAALERAPSGGRGPRVVVDAGTGSGCLAVTLACEWPGTRVIATDISPAALHVAARNIARHGVGGRVALVRTDLVAALPRGLDLIVSNPPYVPEAARPVLPPEVRDYEPAAALFGGADGFELIHRLLAQAASRLRPDGLLIMEFGAGLDDRVEQAVGREPALDLVEIRSDLQQIPRVAVIQRRSV